jgi:hypothetical protein
MGEPLPPGERLPGRMAHYVRGHARQRTSARIKGPILTALNAGSRVEILITTPGHSVERASGADRARIGSGVDPNDPAGLEHARAG